MLSGIHQVITADLNNPAVKYIVHISRTFEIDKFGNVGNSETNVSPHSINLSALPPQFGCSCFNTPFQKRYSRTSLLIHSDSSPNSSLESPEEEVQQFQMRKCGLILQFSVFSAHEEKKMQHLDRYFYKQTSERKKSTSQILKVLASYN